MTFLRSLALLPLFAPLLALMSAQAADGPVYELRVYTCEPGKLDALHARFREHTCKLFEKHGMKNVAYWTPTDGETAANTLIYVLEHESREAAEKSWAGFRSDPDWLAVKEATEKAGKILSKPVESTFLRLVDYSPDAAPVDPKRVYELRTYVANDGKLDALNARFRNHTCKLFEKHGIKNVAYWVPADDPASTNTLIYVVSHESREAAQASWKAFSGDADWQSARKASEEAGPLLAGRPQSVYMATTDYSPRPAK
jgi:hypothetical protein